MQHYNNKTNERRLNRKLRRKAWTRCTLTTHSLTRTCTARTMHAHVAGHGLFLFFCSAQRVIDAQYIKQFKPPERSFVSVSGPGWLYVTCTYLLVALICLVGR